MATVEKQNRWAWLCSGERASFITWLTTLAILGVCSILLYRTVYKSWSENGIPGWMVSYERWEKRQRYEWGLWWRYGSPRVESTR